MGEEKYEGKIESREFLPGDDGSGMGLTGKWMSKRTGQTINIKQTIQEGDNMIIITDKGQISMDVFSREFIQVSDDIYDESGKVIGHESATGSDVSDAAEIAEYEKMYGVDPLTSTPSTPQQAPINNEQIIKKVFDKLTTFPQINVDIKWDDFPEAQINTLVEFLDVDVKDLSAYIIKNYVNVEALAIEISDILNNKLHLDSKNIDNETNE